MKHRFEISIHDPDYCEKYNLVGMYSMDKGRPVYEISQSQSKIKFDGSDLPHDMAGITIDAIEAMHNHTIIKELKAFHEENNA